jgi:hypothetical protein
MSSGGRVYAAGESPRRRVSKVRVFYARAAAEKRALPPYRHGPACTPPHEPTGRALRGVLDDDADGARAAPIARAPAAKLYAARAVQVVELEVPARGRGAGEGRPAAAADWQQQPRVSASRGRSRRPRRRRRGRRAARGRRKSKRMAWDASTLRAGGEECAGGSVGCVESRRTTVQTVG